MASCQPAVLKAHPSGSGQARLVEIGHPCVHVSWIMWTAKGAIQLMHGDARMYDEVRGCETASHAIRLLQAPETSQIAGALARVVVGGAVVLVKVASGDHHQVG